MHAARGARAQLLSFPTARFEKEGLREPISRCTCQVTRFIWEPLLSLHPLFPFGSERIVATSDATRFPRIYKAIPALEIRLLSFTRLRGTPDRRRNDADLDDLTSPISRRCHRRLPVAAGCTRGPCGVASAGAVETGSRGGSPSSSACIKSLRRPATDERAPSPAHFVIHISWHARATRRKEMGDDGALAGGRNGGR